MTTIAYKDGVMASDSALGDADSTYAGAINNKIYVIPEGLLGCAGDPNEAVMTEDFLEAMAGEYYEMFNALVQLCKCGVTQWDGLVVKQDNPFKVTKLTITGEEAAPIQIIPYEISDGYGTAIGSGAIPAEVAMHCGLDAVCSIDIAAKYDGHTGGPVQFAALQEIKLANAETY